VRGRGALRLAFYGWVSTWDWQDPVTSRVRQLQQAVMLVAGRGVIVAEFFDTGRAGSCLGRGARSRAPWSRSSRTRTGSRRIWIPGSIPRSFRAAVTKASA
jgi:hypothetical protein